MSWILDVDSYRFGSLFYTCKIKPLIVKIIIMIINKLKLNSYNFLEVPGEEINFVNWKVFWLIWVNNLIKHLFYKTLLNESLLDKILCHKYFI